MYSDKPKQSKDKHNKIAHVPSIVNMLHFFHYFNTQQGEAARHYHRHRANYLQTKLLYWIFCLNDWTGFVETVKRLRQAK